MHINDFVPYMIFFFCKYVSINDRVMHIDVTSCEQLLLAYSFFTDAKVTGLDKLFYIKDHFICII